jgi:hypothetical protein
MVCPSGLARNEVWRVLRREAAVYKAEPAHRGGGWRGNRSAGCGRSRGSTCSKNRRRKLIDRQSQESLLVSMSGISPAKRNLVIQERDETAIGDRHAMGVSAEVAKHLLGPAESWFAIDHPARNKKLTDRTPQQSGLRQTSEEAMELELSGMYKPAGARRRISHRRAC